jgi:hypothetical protein
MGLPTDIGLIEGFSGLRSLHKIVNAQKSQTRAIRDASSQAGKDAEQLRASLDENSKQQVAAQREGNQVLMQQLQVQQQQLQLQQQQVESQLRIEQASSDQHALDANEDEMVSAMWACVDGAKNNLKDRKFYSSLIFGVSARLAYGQVVPQSQKSDTKMKLSQLNDEARDIIDQVLTDGNYQALVEEASHVLETLKSLTTSTSAVDANAFFESSNKSLAAIDLSSNDTTRIQESMSKLQSLDRDLHTEHDNLSKAIGELSQNEFVLTPLSESSIRDFLNIHAEEVRKLKKQAEALSGINVDGTLESVDQLEALDKKLLNLHNDVKAKIASSQAEIVSIKNLSSKLGMKAKNRIFWLVLVIGLFFSIILGTLLGSDGSPQRATPVQFWFFGMVVYWFVLRSQKKKLRSQLGIG